MQLSNFLEDTFLRKKITIEMQKSIYERAVKWTEVDTRLPKESFPQSLPDEFGLDNLIDIDYIHQYLRQYACYEKY